MQGVAGPAEVLAWMHSNRVGLSKAVLHFGIGRSTISRWRKRARLKAEAEVTGTKPKPVKPSSPRAPTSTSDASAPVGPGGTVVHLIQPRPRDPKEILPADLRQLAVQAIKRRLVRLQSVPKKESTEASARIITALTTAYDLFERVAPPVEETLPFRTNEEVVEFLRGLPPGLVSASLTPDGGDGVKVVRA
jgi:hypothetical protein